MEHVTKILAEVTGSVWKIPVHEGETVAKGTVVAILESMKMEVGCEAPTGGVVSEIAVREGDSLNEGDVIMQIVDEGQGNA